MSEDEEVFFGPVSQEEKKLIRQYGSRRTEIYYQSCPLDRCSLLEFRRKNCLDKNVLFPHSLQQDLMKKHSKTKASYVLENVDIESENDPSNLESSVEISNNAEDITRNTEGMSTLNLTSSRSSASTDVNETSFEPDSLSYFPSEEDSITEDSLQNSVHSNGAFPNLSSSSTFVSISHEDRFRHLKGEVEKHDDNKQDLLSLQTVKIPVVCDQNNTVASSDNTKSLESLQMNDINEGGNDDSTSLESLNLSCTPSENLSSDSSIQESKESDAACSMSGPPSDTIMSEKSITVSNMEQRHHEHDVEDYLNENLLPITDDECDEKKFVKDQECQTSFMIHVADAKVKSQPLVDERYMKEEKSASNKCQQLEKSERSELKPTVKPVRVLTPCSENRKTAIKTEFETNKQPLKQWTPGRAEVFKTPEPLKMKPQRIPCTPTVSGSDTLHLGTPTIKSTPNSGKAERFKHIVSPVAQYIRKAPPTPLIANSKPLQIKKSTPRRKLPTSDNPPKPCITGSKVGTPAIKSKPRISDETKAMLKESEDTIDLKMEIANKENWNVDETILKRFGLTLKEFQCMGNTQLKQEVISFIQVNQSQIEQDIKMYEEPEMENLKPTLPCSIYLGASSLAVVQNERHQGSKVNTNKNKILSDYFCPPTILKHTGQRKVMYRTENVNSGSSASNKPFQSSEIAPPMLIKLGNQGTTPLNPNMSTVDVSIVEPMDPFNTMLHQT